MTGSSMVSGRSKDCFPAAIRDEDLGREMRKAKIYVVAPDGTDLQRLAGDILSTDIEAVWSPDSQRIAFASWREDRTGEIGVMDADGTNQKRLTHTEG